MSELNNEVRKRGRPAITDQALRKTPLIRREVRGRPKKYVEENNELTLQQQRYKDRYAYIHKTYYFIKNNNGIIPNELLKLPTETDEQVKTQYYLIKKFIENYKIEQEEKEAFKIYKPRKLLKNVNVLV
jgi:hypothetical protein